MKFTKILKSNIPYVMFFYLGNIFSNHIFIKNAGNTL